MAFIQDFRAETGDEYKDYTDTELAKAFHSKYQDDTGQKVDFEEFASEFGVVTDNSKQLAEQAKTSPYGNIRENFIKSPTVEDVNKIIPYQSTWDSVSNALQNIPEDFMQQYYGLKIAESETSMERLKEEVADLESRGIKESSAHYLLSEYGKELPQEFKDLTESQKERKPVFVEPGSVSYYASAATSSMGNTLPAVVAGVFMGPEVSLTMFYAQAKGRAYLEGREAGLTPEIADDYATYTGLAEAIPELLPLHFILKPGVNFFSRVLKGAAAEVVQEEITELLQIGLDKEYINEDMTWAEARQRLVDAGILAAVIGPAQAAIAHPLVKAKEAMSRGPKLAEELNNAPKVDTGQEPVNSAQEAMQEAVKDSESIDKEYSDLPPMLQEQSGITDEMVEEKDFGAPTIFGDQAGPAEPDITDMTGTPKMLQPQAGPLPETAYEDSPTVTGEQAGVTDEMVKVDSKAGMEPGDSYSGFINQTFEDESVELKDPIRREKVLTDFAKNVGTRIYAGRVKAPRLGTYTPIHEAVRIKKMNDLEVAAHEIAHFIDDKVFNGFNPNNTRPWLHGPNARTYAKELKGVSYDKKKVYEGFAEFVRLWTSQPEKARQAAPEFTKYWEDFVNSNEYGDALKQAQADITGWFGQDAVNRAASKIGGENIVLNESMDTIGEKARQAIFDDLEGILKMETTLTDEAAGVSAGPYESARLMRAAHSIVDGALRYGPPKIMNRGEWQFIDRDGNPSAVNVGGKAKTNPDYKRWGLRDVLKPVINELNEWTLYATGISAQELKGQNRENLFKQDEIDAMIALGDGKPHFKEVFDDYQKWNSKVLDFAEQTGILGKEQREKFRRSQYIPFYRVSQGAGAKTIKTEGNIKPITMLTGGTNNLKDILGNMVQNATGLIVEGIKNHARQESVRFALSHRGGGQFIDPIPKDVKSVQIDQKQLEDTFLKGLGINPSQYRKMAKSGQGNPTIDQLLEMLNENMEDFVKLYMYGQPPVGSNVIAVLFDGKPQFYEIADPLLMKTFTSFNRKHPGIVRKIFSAIRRIGQSSITLTADFMTANIWRDTLHGFVISKHGFKPVIDSFRGLRSRITQDATYREAIANGVGMSSYLVDPKDFEANLKHFYESQGIDFKSVLSTPRKMLLGLELIADAFEMSTRLGEFGRGIQKDETARTSAFGAREVSVDFAMRGDAELLNVMYDTVLFLKAGMNGLDRIYRGFTKDPNKAAILTKSAGIAAASAALYAINRGNPCYDDLEDWDKDTHWHIFVPRGTGDCNSKYVHLRFPKIWEIGALASTAERSVGLYLDKVEKGHADGDKYAKRIREIFVDLFKMEYLPQAVAPLAEVYWLNRNRFSDRDIETESMQELLPFARYSPYTNKTLVDIAELTADLPPELQFSPAKSQALIRGYFGTWGMYGLFMSDELLKGDQLPEWRTDEYPVLRRFTRAHPLRRTQYEKEFWDLAKEAAMYTKTGKKMIKQEKEGLAEKFIEQDPAPLYKMLTKIKGSVKGINDAMISIHRDPILNSKEKRKQLDELQAEKNAIFKEVMISIKESK